MFKKETIIKLLEERGWSNYKLCKESPATLSDILNGKSTNPKTETLEKIAKALNVSMDDFFIEDNKNSIDEQQSSNPDDFDELDPEIRAIARDMKNMSSKNKELLKELIKTMSKVGDDELNK